jgi:uracil-DNA glycosylase family 4
MTNDQEDEHRALIRQVRQRLESLGRAGLVHIPVRSGPKLKGPVKAGLSSRPNVDGPAAPPNTGVPDVPAIEIRPDPVPIPSLPPIVQAMKDTGPTTKVKHETEDQGPRTKDQPSKTSLFAESGFESPPISASERPAVLAASAAEVAGCRRCPHLAASRTQTVFGTGSPTTRLMFIGEAPGADEDRTGKPFVGVAGQLLTDMITKGMGLSREDVYIANVLKCRPPGNRTPTTEEAANCSSYLDHQIAVIRPEFLCLLGKTAAIAVLDLPPMTTMGPLRKRWHTYKGIKTLVTYHPSYLLRNPPAKKDAWEDLQLLMKEMGLQVPRRN